MKLGAIVHPLFTDSFKKLMTMPGIPPRSMFMIRGIAKIIRDESEKFEETRKALVEAAGVRDENGKLLVNDGMVSIDPEKVSELQIKLKELSNIEVEMPLLKFSDFGEKVSLVSEDIYRLEFITE